MTPEEKAVIDAAIAARSAYRRNSSVMAGAAASDLIEAVDALVSSRMDPKRWTPATFLYVLAGDRIRIGTDETDVLRSPSGAWHANVVSSVLPSGKVWDKVTPWEHTELRLDLSANPGFREYPADTPCEILCTPERLAVLTLMTVFPGTKEIKP